MYDLVIVTHLPAFYKVNLYNKISENNNIFVIFVSDGSLQRTKDFVSSKMTFDHQFLNFGSFESRSKLYSILRLIKFLSKISYRRIIVNGWDLIEFWFLVFVNRREKNILVLESTINESTVFGIKGFFKKIFLSRISKILASGSKHCELVKKLGFCGELRITKGVGLINKNKSLPVFFEPASIYPKRFLFLGRLSEEKNLFNLIEVFNQFPDCYLNIVGKGPLKRDLLTLCRDNIQIQDHVANENISDLFKGYDFLILPSISETWGLVVEEALHFNLPVIISNKCGAVELVEHGVNGYIVEPDFDSLKSFIQLITSRKKSLALDCFSTFIHDKDVDQINSYNNL
ncbi:MULTISPECIES: glycosyltransferase family 4 protein [unclassified Endozoicomonas]|uniref:glycosyltransferase family 4 protein n=1 Tax=unclassified Endozoicomonas TaxID=2644528 RepID=UPI002147BD0F|nr:MULTISPECIES: glycosyltransferase family 4 protein [unclassified Endozoicomonas]